MQSRTPNPALLGVFWLGIQVVWGAVLAISLQARASDVAGHAALSAYGLLATCGAAMAGIAQIAAGVFSDRRRLRGSRRIEFYVWGAGVASVALFWFYLAPSFAQLLAAFVLLQFAMNVASGPYQAAIPDFVPQRLLGTASSWMAALQSVGNAAGAVIAGLIADVRIVACAISVLLLSTCAATVAHVRTLPLLESAPQGRMQITKAFADLFASRALVYLGFYTLVGYLYFYVGSKELTGLVLLVFTVAGALGAWAGAAPANTYDRRAVASVGGGAFVAALFAFLISHATAAVFASALLAGAAWGVFLTADWALGCGFLPRFALATAMGIWNLALLIPQIVAPIVATAVLSLLHALQQHNAPRIAFVVAAAEVTAGIAWIWRLPASSAIPVDSAVTGNTP
ncbi:MAG TPA: MFS transporter [Candidatus Baltobacteraceae bacterium]|jgi:MFS family permease|nr:MFS transporter [Candidatus Baltobacteraceae bacterium]